MKKLSLFIATALLLSFSTNNHSPKEYNLKLTPEQLQQLWYVVERSNAEHQLVTGIQQLINTQIQAQNRDTTQVKPPKIKAQDTTTVKPKK